MERPPLRARTSQPAHGDRPEGILLVGMMGSGKTTVGREVAARLGWVFLDNDDLVRQLTGREPATIDAEDGEGALHDAEIAAFRTAIMRDGSAVIAVAGAVVDAPDARAALADAGHVVWLRARPETLLARIGAGASRRADALDLEWLRARSAERASAYADVADQVIDVDTAAVGATADRILDGLTSAG